MKKEELALCLNREYERWSLKSYQELLAELKDPANYECAEGDNRVQVEVLLLEDNPDYVHVMVAVDDGGWRAFNPLSRSFIIHRDGRIET